MEANDEIIENEPDKLQTKPSLHKSKSKSKSKIKMVKSRGDVEEKETSNERVSSSAEIKDDAKVSLNQEKPTEEKAPSKKKKSKKRKKQTLLKKEETTEEVVKTDTETEKEEPIKEVKTEEEEEPKKEKSKIKTEKKKGKKTKKKKHEEVEETPKETTDEEIPKEEKKRKVKKKKSGVKVTKSTSTSKTSIKKKKKSEDKKKKKPRKHKESVKTSQSVSTQSLTKKTHKTKKSSSTMLRSSRPSFVELLSRLSLHTVEMEKIKSQTGLKQESSVWAIEESSSSSYEGSYEEDEESATLKTKSSVRFKHKRKGKKKDKEKVVKEEEITEPVKPKKSKKGKKGKKVKLVEEEEETIEPQVDILAEITRMKYLAELEASGEETEADTVTTSKKKKKKKKKGAKKKLSKKEKARIAAEQAEKARQTAEEDAAKAAELERIRLEEERIAAIAKEKRETQEQLIRLEQLTVSQEIFEDFQSFTRGLRENERKEEDWEFYVNCGRLPNPAKCDDMNTFLHLWENDIQGTTMEEAAQRTNDVLELLAGLDDLIDIQELENWKWVRLLFREHQAKSLDVATYRLLRDIEKKMHRIDIPTADFRYQDKNISLCLWLRIQLPVPLPNPRKPPKSRIEINFPEIKMEVLFPTLIDGEKTAIRALYLKYDHLSDLCDSYHKPVIPPQYDINLLQSTTTEWREKLLYKYNNRVRKPVQPIEGEENPQEPPPEPVFGADDEIPIVPYRKLEPTASDYVITQEDALYNDTKEKLIKIVSNDIINLRKFTIIGGVYSLNLLKQPPQPQDFVTLEMTVTPLYLPKELEYEQVILDFNPPPPPLPGVRRAPEEIEEEMKKQEEELDKLIFVTLSWPEHVIFLELPLVCYWDEKNQIWTKQDVHDLKHNEEKGFLTFRTSRFGIFGLAAYRYANLPYQAWEMKPEIDGSVTLQITAAILLLEFNIKDGLIAVTQLQNSPNNALEELIGCYLPLNKLIRVLQNSGVDVFPAFDAFCYVENSCEKHWPMEKHLYFNMAQTSNCFNFAWSRWNISSDRRSIILQSREYNSDKIKQKNHYMLHVTPLSALYVDCTEVSQTFNAEGIENMKFYPDLYHLIRGTSGIAIKNKIAQSAKEQVFAVYELLEATRIVSFS